MYYFCPNFQKTKSQNDCSSEKNVIGKKSHKKCHFPFENNFQNFPYIFAGSLYKK